MEAKIKELRELVSEDFMIKLEIGKTSKVTIIPDSFEHKTHPWTHFVAGNIEEALDHTIRKLTHPDEDYIDNHKTIWKADEESVYGAKHTRLFLV